MKIGLPKIVKYETCVGVKFFHVGRYALELWFCPPQYNIKPHRHPNQTIKLMFLFGSAVFSRWTNFNPVECFKAKFPRDCGKVFTIGPQHFHTFSVNNKWLVFLNLEVYRAGVEPTSAALDMAYD